MPICPATVARQNLLNLSKIGADYGGIPPPRLSIFSRQNLKLPDMHRPWSFPPNAPSKKVGRPYVVPHRYFHNVTTTSCTTPARKVGGPCVVPKRHFHDVAATLCTTPARKWGGPTWCATGISAAFRTPCVRSLQESGGRGDSGRGPHLQVVVGESVPGDTLAGRGIEDFDRYWRPAFGLYHVSRQVLGGEIRFASAVRRLFAHHALHVQAPQAPAPISPSILQFHTDPSETIRLLVQRPLIFYFLARTVALARTHAHTHTPTRTLTHTHTRARVGPRPPPLAPADGNGQDQGKALC